MKFVNIHSMEILPLPAQKKRENFPEKQNKWKWFDLAKRCYLVHTRSGKRTDYTENRRTH